MIRGCLLDQRAYRAAAADEKGTNDAWLALGFVFLMTSIGPYLIYFTVPSVSQLISIVLMTGIQVAGMAAGAALISALSPSIAGVKVSFGQVLRPLAYAQSIGVFGFLGMIATVLGIWRIVTSLTAIRAVIGCDPVKAAVLLIIGGIGSILAAMLLSPLVLTTQFF
ncbi:MAG: hypothetical protein JSU96_01735 [Acidobacteriota bacterium]|nr:MAG: hypothetical protein JSU96_01735 [Acidobacteriota bacterium]